MPSTLSSAEVQRLERTLFDAMIAEDVALLEKLLSEELIFIHSSGQEQSKSEYLDAIRKSYDYKSFDPFDEVYHCYPGLAIVTSTVHLTSRKKSDAEDFFEFSALRDTHVWVEGLPDAWQLQLRHATLIRGVNSSRSGYLSRVSRSTRSLPNRD